MCAAHYDRPAPSGQDRSPDDQGPDDRCHPTRPRGAVRAARGGPHTCAGRTRYVSSDHSSAVAEAGDWLADYLTSLGGQADSKDCKLHGRAAGHSEAPAPLPYLRPATLAYGHGTERIGVLPLLGSSSLVIPGVRGAAAHIRKHRYAAAGAIRQRCGCPGQACSSCLQCLSLYCCQQSSLGLHPRAVHQVPIDQFHAADPPAGQERPWTTGVGR